MLITVDDELFVILSCYAVSLDFVILEAAMAENRSRTVRDRRVLRVGLHVSVIRKLAEAASQSGLTAEQLAAAWITERTSVAAALRTLTDPSLQISRPGGEEQTSRRATRGRRKIASKTSRQRTALHDEIVAVLSRGDGPMTVAEIAAEIRRRGHYRGPRTKRPVSAAMVSNRVSNPQYRGMFERTGRGLSLVTPTREVSS
jgi:hypothetical protein